MFHDIEQKIVDRLKAVLPAEVHVDTLHELERVPELRQKAPAVWVIYDGFSVGPKVPPGTVQQVVQEWFVVIAAKSAKGRGDSSAARDEASAIALQDIPEGLAVALAMCAAGFRPSVAVLVHIGTVGRTTDEPGRFAEREAACRPPGSRGRTEFIARPRAACCLD